MFLKESSVYVLAAILFWMTSNCDAVKSKDEDTIVIKIVPSYTPPFSFSLGPPFYRAASSLSLSCEVEGVEDDAGLIYQWSSTCSGSCFVRGEITQTVSTPYLHSYDSGIHTCVVHDRTGCSGNASITIDVVGAGIYVVDSNNGGQVLSNNSVIITNPSNYIPEFRCLSGSTTPNVGNLVDPLGNDITDSFSDSLFITRGGLYDPGSLHVRMIPQRPLQKADAGVYTYRTPDESGNMVDFNFGIYLSSNETSPPPPVVASMEHSPLTTPFTISCLTHDSPPMKIIWKKDEEVINFTNNSIDYQLTQTLVNRTSSTYNNTLTINGTIEDVIGEYSCAVANRLGTSNTLSKSVKALHLSGYESPVIVGVSRDIVCTTFLNVTRMEWVLEGASGAPVEERDDGGQSLVLTLNRRTMGLNGARFKCRVTTQHGNSFQETIALRVKELDHILEIDAPVSPLLAGNTYSITCQVTSDVPPLVKWLDPNGSEITAMKGMISVKYQAFKLNSTSISLTFDPLTASHGGKYVCMSQINATILAQKNLTKDIIVQIPPPTVSIIRTPNISSLYTTNSMEMVCITEIHLSADVPTHVNTTWVKASSRTALTSNDRMNISSKSKGLESQLTASYSSLLSSDSGRYTCSSNIMPNASSRYVVASETISASTSFTAGLNVSISISYTPPDQYPDYSPPNYRAASSVRLRCVVSGAAGSVSYRWSSTCRSCFASSSSSSSISESMLRSRDAGVHTCTVIDNIGNRGSASIQMNIVGIGIHMTTYNTGYGLGSNPANTFATIRTGYSSSSIERLSLYCCSNSTRSNVGSFKYPSQGSITSGSNGFQVTRYSSGSSYAGCMKVAIYSTRRSSYYYYSSSRRYYSSLSQSGIYVCEMPDLRGVTQRANIGLYTSSYSPYIYYFRRVSSRETLTINCRTYRAPPTNIIWYKNGTKIDIDGDVYRLSQRVTDFRSSYYDNTLLVRGDPERDMIGSYHCYVSKSKNVRGRNSTTLNIQGLQIQTLKTSLVRTGWYNRVRSITEYLNSPNLTVGTTGVRFKCSSDLDVTRIEWYREDNLTSTSSSSTAYVNHGMVSTDDEGTEYSCSVISPYASQTKEIILSVILPSNWGRVSITAPPGGSPLHGTNYSLLCTVTTIAGMTLPLTLEWVGPDGTVVDGDENRTVVGVVGTQETVSTISLYFDPVLTSDGGTYTCRAYIDPSLLSIKPEPLLHSFKMPVTTQALFQLKMHPLPHCANWDVRKAQDVESSIKRELESAVRERCDCNFSSRSIFSGEFSCQSTSSLITHVIYRATINGTSDLLTADQIMEHIDDWHESGGTLLYNVFRLKLSSKSECPLTIESLDDKEC